MQGTPSAERVGQVREAFAALTRALKRVSIYRHATGQHSAYLEPALSALVTLLEQENRLALGVEPTGLTWEGESVYSEPAREWSLCFRLHQAGVRELFFLRGISIDELKSFVAIAMPDPLGANTGREDALTELWKAELSHVQYQAVDIHWSNDDRQRLAAAIGLAQAVLAGEGARVEQAAPPLVAASALASMSDESWRDLARRAAATVLAIVEARFSGRDLDSLREAFARLLDEMLRQGEPVALRAALERAALIPAPMGPEFRAPLASRMAEPERLERLAQLGDSSEVLLGAIPAWLALLPPDAGNALLGAAAGEGAPGARTLLARAAAARIESCRARYEELLPGAPAGLARLLLSALEAAPPLPGAAVAAAALGHKDTRVLIDAIAHVAVDPKLAPRRLGGLLNHREAPVRVAAAGALSRAQPEAAAPLLLAAMGRPEFDK